MAAYLVKRFSLMVLTLFGISVIIFVLLRVVPGDIAYRASNQTASYSRLSEKGQMRLIVIVLKRPVWHVLRQLGGPGLIVLGLVDNSVVPLPGSMDAFTIVLSADTRNRGGTTPSWPRLALSRRIPDVPA